MLYTLRYSLLLVLPLCGFVHDTTTPSLTNEPPNVILVIADQMRGDVLSILDHPNARTPNLDRMARAGVLFTHYFVNNPVCVPSRMSMFSGLYPHEHGALSNKSTEARLPSAENTLLGYFADRKYRLGWFGKDNHTYDRAILDSLLDANTSRRREPFRAYAAHTPPHWYSATPWPREKLFAYQTTTDALDFIKANKAAPFFAVLSLFDPHPPYFAPAEYVANYPVQDIERPEYIDAAAISDRLDYHRKAMLFEELGPMELESTMAHYYAAIEWGVDAQIGRLLDTLEEERLTENTIVLFTSEHGDFMGEYGMVRKGMFLYDALLHVPFIWYAPGRIRGGIQTDYLAQGVDIFPTLVELTGGEAPACSGRSLLPVLEHQDVNDDSRTVFASAGYSVLADAYFDNPEPPYYEPADNDEDAFHTRVFGRQTSPSERTAMARTREWKLILSSTHPPELFQMSGGWIERDNVASNPAYKGILDTLSAQIKELSALE